MQKNIFSLLVLLLPALLPAQTPILNSNPGITDKVLYLDFDGQKVTGTGWNNGATINASPSGRNANQKTEIWKRVSEDYRPFDINVTTDSLRFNNANPVTRMRVIITPTSAWYGSAGGVAFVNSFTWGGTPGTPCWVFENMLNHNVKSISEAISHEAGHTLSLRHQSRYNASCVKTDEYHDGSATGGVTGWAPIMGVGYSRNVTIWHNGQSAVSCTTIQRDHDSNPTGITGPGRLNYLPDDIGNNYANARLLNITSTLTTDSGLITTPSDLDAFRFEVCNTSGFTFNMKPWALDTTNYSGANLDIRFHLYDSNNTLIVLDTTLTRLHTLVTVTLNPGSYYFTIDGGRSNNYPDYGSLGKYFVRIKAQVPPPAASNIVLPSSLCAGQTFTLTSSSNNNPTSWQWTVTSVSSSSNFAVQDPSMSLGAGIHTITLLSSNSSTLNACPVTTTMQVGTPPSISVNGSSVVVCPPKTVTLSVSGAQTYTWYPGALAGSSQILSPTVTTSYTVLGSNSGCNDQAVTTVSVNPPFTLDAQVTATQICIGETITITGTGATNYTIQPGNITTNPAVLSPSNTVGYTIIGQSGSCTKTIIKTVNVSPPVFFHLVASDSSLCAGQPATLTASGVSSYTFEPGGQSGNQVVISPTVNTTYTVTGANLFNCSLQKQISITAEPCDYTAIAELAETNIRIYPNPAGAEFRINGAHTAVQVHDALGRMVFASNEACETELINTLSWPAGIYLVKVDTIDSSYILKLIRE